MPRVTRHQRNSISDRPGRWKLLARRYRGYARPALWGVLGIGLLALGTGVARSTSSEGTLASMRERFGRATASFGLRVQEVEVEGRANTPEPLLRAAIGVGKGEPILGVSVAAARSRVEALAWVEHATVERRLPGKIVVSLQERRPYAIWQNQGKFTLIDRDGQVVTKQNLAQFGHLPLIVGAGAPAAAAELIDALTERPALQSHLVAAVRVGERRWNLHMSSGADIMLPEGHEVTALDRLLALQQEHALLDRPIVAIDMRLPDRLVIRAQPNAAPADPAPAQPSHVAPAPVRRPT